MESDFPLVSVIIPSYNHEKYVGMAIASVLQQSYQNFELVILDDASTDGSVNEILKFQDNRIRFSPLKKNSGAVPAINKLIELAKGKYIALLNSDDFWEKDKLLKQVSFMEEHREFGMAFSSARIVTQESTPENISEIPETLFDQKSLNQGKMLRKMFFELNFLCHPSILIRRELYRPEHPYNYALRQCPDFEMYIFLLNNARIYYEGQARQS
jgi:glycosyltransferase involved in cell wall biosynthesis